jgi:hypothetical protein
MENKKKPYLSQSQLSMFEMCAESYRRRYICGEKIPPPIVMLRGTSVHKGAQENFKYKLKHGVDLRESNIVEIAAETFEMEVKKSGLNLTEMQKLIGAKKVKGRTKDDIVLLSKIFSREVAPRYMPKFVEEEHLIVVNDCDYNLLAKMDLCDIKDVITDLKTSAKKKAQSECDRSEQKGFYSLVFKALTGKLPKGFNLENLTLKAERQLLQSKPTMDDLNKIILRLNMMIKSIKEGVYMPTNPMNWKCNANYCGYYSSCKYQNKPR